MCYEFNRAWRNGNAPTKRIRPDMMTEQQQSRNTFDSTGANKALSLLQQHEIKVNLNKNAQGDFPAVQWLRFCAFLDEIWKKFPLKLHYS